MTVTGWTITRARTYAADYWRNAHWTDARIRAAMAYAKARAIRDPHNSRASMANRWQAAFYQRALNMRHGVI